MNNEFSIKQYNNSGNRPVNASEDDLYLFETDSESAESLQNNFDEFISSDLETNTGSFKDGKQEYEDNSGLQSGLENAKESEAAWEETGKEEEYEFNDEADDRYTGETISEYFTTAYENEFEGLSETANETQNDEIIENEFLERSLEESENANFAGTSSVRVPEFMEEDLSVPGYTCYVNINIGKGNYPLDMTGIYVPSNFNPAEPADVIIYLHGMTGAFPGGNSRINDYWKVTKLPDYDLRIREEINASGKNVILVAPSIGKSPNSYINSLSGKNGGLDNYLEKVLSAVNTYIVQKRFNFPAINFRNIILSAHSAGGRQMRLISAAANPVYGSKITECWGFDSLYSNMNGWLSWAKSNPGKKLFIYFKSSTTDNARYLKNNSKHLSNIFIKQSAAKNHYWVPKYHMKERVINIGQDSITKLNFEADPFHEHEFFSKESTKNWSNAIRLNQSYGASLGWNNYYDQINSLVLPYSGYQNVSLGEEAFAIAVSGWQRSRGFSEKDSDGIIGPNTWRTMQPLLNLTGAPPSSSQAPSYIPSYPSSGTGPSIQNIPEFNRYYARKIIDNMNAGIIGQNFDSMSQLEKLVRSEQVLNVNPQSRIIQILPLISHISEQARQNNYREIMIGSFIRSADSSGKCTGHCEGRCIDINFKGGSFESSGSVTMVKNILTYLTVLPQQFKKSIGFGMPLQGEFFGKKNLAKFKSVPASNLINADLRLLVPQLGYVFPDNNNHLHIQIAWL